MTAHRNWSVLVVVLLLISATQILSSQNAPISANSEPTYQTLRHVKVSGEAFQVSNLVLKRDVGTFTLNSGTLCFLEPVAGMITGAVFKGKGTFDMLVNDPVETRQMKMLFKDSPTQEDFETLTLRFSDGTADEIRKSAAVKPGGSCTPDPLDDMNHQLRSVLHYNLTGRLLQPVLAGAPDGFFMAAIRGRHFSDRMYFVIDPMGIPEGLQRAAPEEVMMMSTQDNYPNVWYSSHLQNEIAAKVPITHENGYILPSHYDVEATFAKNARMEATATVTLTSRIDGLRVIPLGLYHTLRTQKVTDAAGSALNWIQEDKDDDYDFYVILAKPLAHDETARLTISYAGNDAVLQEGVGNYLPVARWNWYPNGRHWGYATYDLTLHVPKGNTMAATGTLISNKTENGQNTTVWKSEVPIGVAGFNFGTFHEEAMKLEKLGIELKAYANTELPDALKWRQNAAPPQQRMGEQILTENNNAKGLQGRHAEATSMLATLSTAEFAKRALAEAQLALLLYADFYGPISYKSVLVTQQATTTFGQSWPGLVYLPMVYFMDTTQRHALNWNEADPYFRFVAPRELAREWWGQTVGWSTYRDQWMSDGFPSFSASLFLQLVRNDRNDYLRFWEYEKRALLEKNKFGVRPIDDGPLVLGRRLNNSHFSGATDRLLAPKGAYVLHMLRMLMMGQNGSDDRFKAMMQEFAKTYANRPASTDDFKRVTEKYMTQQMDLDRNHTMNWFFDEWVYGTEIPDYHIDSHFTKQGENIEMEFTLKQSNVSETFRNSLPIYLEMSDGRIIRLGVMGILGTKPVTQKLSLGPAKELPRRALLNVNFDTLCTIDGN
ncbi:MAG TPA: M1 family aminopeptidase [Candidatus Acidoferrales bacterium]|nr:M1 family aminopeptidase [Candidatus Acidoferrales bacterium]